MTPLAATAAMRETRMDYRLKRQTLTSGFDVRVRVVIDQLEILAAESKEVLDVRIDRIVGRARGSRDNCSCAWSTWFKYRCTSPKVWTKSPGSKSHTCATIMVSSA